MATYRAVATGTTSATITPVVGDLFVVFVCCQGSANTSPSPPTDNNGGTYTLISALLKNSSADSLACFVRNQLLPNTTSTIVSPAVTGTHSNTCVIAVSGMNRVGSNAVVQNNGQSNQAATGTPAPAFSGSALTGNMTLGAIGNGETSGLMTPPTNWIERADFGTVLDTDGLEVVTRDSGFTGTTVTWGSTSATAFASMIVELDATQAPGVGSSAGIGAATAGSLALNTYPFTAAQMATAVGYGTWTSGYLCEEASGSLADVFAVSASLPVGSGTPTFGVVGPLDGTVYRDKAVETTAISNYFQSSGSLFGASAGGDICVAWVGKIVGADVIGQMIGTSGNLATTAGWAAGSSGTALNFGVSDGTNSASITTAGLPTGWYVAIGVHDHAAGKIALAWIAATAATNDTPALVSSTAVTGAISAGQLRLAQSGASTTLDFSALWVGSGSGVAASMSANIATAVKNLRDAIFFGKVAGASTGVATPTAVGASNAASPGASTGIATPTAVGASTAVSPGASSGTSTVTAVGTGIKPSIGEITGVTITKTGGTNNAWDAGASSVQTLTGDGYFEVLPKACVGDVFIGLSTTDSNLNFTSIKYAWYINSGVNANVYENGSTKLGGQFLPNDRLRIRRTGTTITYETVAPDNTTTVRYTSLVTTASALIIDTSLFELTVPAVLAGIRLYNSTTETGPLTWASASTVAITTQVATAAATATGASTAVTRATASGGLLTKTGGGGGWNAGASSVQTIAGDGYVEFSSATTNMLGFSTSDPDQNFTSIGFAVETAATGGLAAFYESGTFKSQHAAGSVYRVQRTGTTITYYVDGVLAYTSLANSSGALLVDSSLNIVGNTIAGILLSDNGTDRGVLTWQNAVSVSTLNQGGASVDTAVGASTAASAGASAGVATATGAGASTAVSPGASAGTSTVSAIGAATFAGAGAGTGTSADTATGASTAASAGASTGIVTPTAIGKSTATAAGASSGTATTAAVGASTAAATATAVGTSVVTATGASNDMVVGEADGASTATASGISTARSAGASASTSATPGVGASTAVAIGAVAGTGSVDGIGAAIAAARATTGGTSFDLGQTSELVTAFSAGRAAGTAFAIASITALSVASASIAGTSSAAAAGASSSLGAGTAAGASIVVATGLAARVAAGAAAGTSTSSATPAVRGASAGVGVASAIGAGTAASPGASQGSAGASAVGASTGASLAHATASSSATASSIVLHQGRGAVTCISTATARRLNARKSSSGAVLDNLPSSVVVQGHVSGARTREE